ncbi:tRNA glutamyl-Q(34) synthetase GluQRS [Psychrobacter phenylpyruvicus]|uniref:Glutamyl-Q tRNA(Asp) synthetase n=2 Tax=Psychrobacter phenylpyruvicus TaxID=29432 RepID=A0A379LN46_9GAMM|nr:tRNA glutamyl-Q(34) synthetase GluQRS [Psychrobacter phenylpyruvicus]SUD91881.1 Glutamyl-Q tRNA(Asp) synthetase [Psychrobacter phenylpyruvicus]
MTMSNNKRPTACPIYRPAVGRFAPSPTGALHLGSLTTAIASYCHIKSLNGSWLLRIEDTDSQRCSAKFSEQILIDLDNLGLHWDGEVWYQAERKAIYNELLYEQLLPYVYGCRCSRKDLADYEIYPRFCLPDPKDAAHESNKLYQNQKIQYLTEKKVRIQLPNQSIGFIDGIQGIQWSNPQQSLGDVVLRRADGTINYFLAASIDDGLQGITHVMRGLDILPLTTAQISIMRYLNLPAVEHWYHLPLVENHCGQKLSKQNLATPIDTLSLPKCQNLIQKALTLLKQPAVELDKPEVMLQQAVAQWRLDPLQHQSVLGKV